MGSRHNFILIIFLTVIASSSSCINCAHDDCLSQRCGEVIVSYPFALADRPDCPLFSPFFNLTCDPSNNINSLYLYSSDIYLYSDNLFTNSLLVKNITSNSLIVDITSLNASLPPLRPNPSVCTTNNTVGSNLWLPPSPGPFFISDENEFGSFGCTYGTLFTSNVLPYNQSSADYVEYYADLDYYNYVDDVHVVSCISQCSSRVDDQKSDTRCGSAHNICCVAPLVQNWNSRHANYSVSQNPFAPNISCSGGTNYATLFHRSSSDLDKGIYYLKLMWGLPSNHTQNDTELHQSPEYACSNNSSFTIVDGVPGYLCSCNPGYDGDGYRNGSGCQEINECNNRPAYPNDCVSTSSCVNQPLGSYTCRCNAWFHVGDGRKHGSGCQISHRLILGLEISAALVFLSSMLGLFFCLAIWWKKRTKKKYFMQHGGLELQEILRSRAGREMRIFKEEELKYATNNYADHMKLGAGGFGTVFKGVLEDETVVAIKKANMSKGVDEGDREQFLNEMAILVRINHRHIVQLLGCCLETKVPLLVYEFISNGNLEQNMEGNNGTAVMGWQQRLEVARQTAEALAYLHAAASPPILHRDVKSANVLLDHNFDAKVADFGLSRLVLDGVEDAATALQGTIGYLDPESIQTLELTEKSDVYSLGVILVELITGLKPVDNCNREPNFSSLAQLFIHRMKEGRLDELIDARLDRNPTYHASFHDIHSSIMAVAALSRRCLDLQGSRRPSMSHVADKIRHIVQSLKSGSNEDEDENAPLLMSSEMTELYAESGAIMRRDNAQSQCHSTQSGSINNLLINAPTSPR